MNNLSIKNIFNKFNFFKEYPMRSLTDIEKKITLCALAVFSFFSIYILYKRYTKKDTIPSGNQSINENEAVNPTVPADENQSPSKFETSPKKHSGVEEETHGLGMQTVLGVERRNDTEATVEQEESFKQVSPVTSHSGVSAITDANIPESTILFPLANNHQFVNSSFSLNTPQSAIPHRLATTPQSINSPLGVNSPHRSTPPRRADTPHRDSPIRNNYQSNLKKIFEAKINKNVVLTPQQEANFEKNVDTILQAATPPKSLPQQPEKLILPVDDNQLTPMVEQTKSPEKDVNEIVDAITSPKINSSLSEDSIEHANANGLESIIEPEKPMEKIKEVIPEVFTLSKEEEESFKKLWKDAEICRLYEEFEEAEEFFEEALKMNPGAALTLSLRGYGFVLCRLAEKMTEEENFEGAEAKYKKALELNPNDLFVMEGYAGFLLGFEDEDEILKGKALLEKLLKMNPSNSTALECFKESFKILEYIKHEIIEHSESDQKLIKRSEKAIRESKGSNKTPNYYGKTPYEEGEYLLKKSHNYLASLKFKEAMTSNPNDDFAKWGYAEALVGLALGYLNVELRKNQLIPAAMIYCKKSLEVVPEHPLAKVVFEASLKKAKEFYQLKGIRLEEELRLSRLNLLDPLKSENTMILGEYGECLYENGEYEEAIITFEKVLKINPKDNTILDSLRRLRDIMAPITV